MSDNNPGPLDGVLGSAADAASAEVDAQGNRKITGAKRGMCAAILTLEGIAFGLVTPVLLTLTPLSTGVALLIGLGFVVVCFVLAGMLKRPWGYSAGHVVQGLVIGLGFIVPMMFVVGGLFALLWGTAYWLGGKIEREKAEAWAAWDAEQAAQAGQA
ncbi:hypothetical protein GCM10011584_13870 [Nocardioides phosphati]|uniref:DUF4233 domain-containing protein n=1 Tax=Nocardioides phosphati TaxID=1867775 RepID=A0ABQ2N9M0_9ACTN|nr:DUF4233 domain-containing protein [Nocardioides phosphati]GGO87970.1 hypothetical protein GCM10011584_13870 [Nocardioides phosphati]